MKVARAIKSEKALRDFFAELSETFGENVPLRHIFNYDETNLTDDHGLKKSAFKRGAHYPERVMNSSKTFTLVMFCGSAAGWLLPSYVVYKAKQMFWQWIMGGPPQTHAKGASQDGSIHAVLMTGLKCFSFSKLDIFKEKNF